MELSNPLKRPRRNAWERKPGESDEEFQARTDTYRERNRDNLAKARAGRDRKPKAEGSSPAVTKRALNTTLSMVNGLVGMFSPADALGKIQLGDQVIDEQEMLVDAIIETQATSPMFRKYLGQFVSAAGTSSLIGAVGLIVYVRLVRHGVLPGPGGTTAPAAEGSAPPGPAPAPAMTEAQFWAAKEYERNHPEEMVGSNGTSV